MTKTYDTNRKPLLLGLLFVIVFGCLTHSCGDLSAANLGSISRLADHAFSGDPKNDPGPSPETPFFGPFAAIDYEGASSLAKITRKQIRRNRPQGKCLRWVRIALTKYKRKREREEGKDFAPFNFHTLPRDPLHLPRLRGGRSPGRSAADFREWAVQNPESLCTELGLANVSEFPSEVIYNGMVLLYKPGECGFHKRWGHIEVVTDAMKSEVCSDHCRKLQITCKPSTVLVPVKHCDWIASDAFPLKVAQLRHRNDSKS